MTNNTLLPWIPVKENFAESKALSIKSYVVSPSWCQKCNLLISDRIRGAYRSAGWILKSGVDPFPDEFFHHHYGSVIGLARSAASGCVLCSSILSRLYPGEIESSGEKDFLYQLYHNSHSPGVISIHGNRTQDSAAYRTVGTLEILTESGFFEPPAKKFISQDRPKYGEYHPWGRKVSHDPLSVECLSLARKWIGECTKLHPHCHRNLIQRLPKRILNVGADPFLFITNGEEAPYIALSYCWGKSVPLRTMKQNLDSHKEGIETHLLPKTFQDAIQIAQKLGFTYLWIDALCIVQDDPVDWDAESAVMGDIYSKAVFTISALMSSDCQQGFLKPRVPSHLGFQITEPQDALAFIRFERLRTFTGALDCRAWTLQERLMSTAILHYAEDSIGMIWECRSRCVFENGIIIRTDPLLKGLWTDLRYAKDSKNRLSRWYGILEDYSQRQLTYSSDRLAAISGLSQSFEEWRGGDYIAGMWTSDLHRGLLWKKGSQWNPKDFYNTKPSQSIAAENPNIPSWSWASHNAKLSMGGLHTARRIKDDLFDLVVLDIQESRVLPAGKMQSAYLEVEGIMRPARLSRKNEYSQFELDQDTRTYIELKPRGKTYCGVILDSETREILDCHLLHVASWKQTFHGARSWRYFLIVEEVENSQKQYRRIGIGYVPYHSIWSIQVGRLQRKRITLV